MGNQGTAITQKGREQAAYNKGERAARKKLNDPTLNLTKSELEAKKKTDPPKATETKPKKKMHPIEKKNRARFGDKHVDKLKAKNTDFKAMKKGTMSKDDFIKKYPKSITAQKAAGLRDHTEWDAYDMVLEYLFSTEQVSTLEEANYVMMEMDQQTVGEIVTEVKQELHELLPLAGLALGINALRKKGKSKRMGKAAGGAAGKFAPAGTAAGKGGSMVAPVPKKPGGAAGKAAGSMGSKGAPKTGKGSGAMSSAMAAVGAPKIEGKPFPKERVAGRDAGKSASRMAKPEAKKVDLSGKSKAQIMALKRLGKI